METENNREQSTVLLGDLYSVRMNLVQSEIQRSREREITRVEAGSNTSTVTLRVVGVDEKGRLKSETVKYGIKSQGTRTRERLRWQGQQHIQKTDPTKKEVSNLRQ
jgi:hypothetical protein